MAEKQALIGEVMTAYRVAEDCMILHGWMSQPLLPDGVAAWPGRTAKGRFRSFCWSRDDDESSPARWFLVVVRLAEIGHHQSGPVLLHGAGGAGPTVAKLPPLSSEAGGFVQELIGRLGRKSGAALQFLKQIFPGQVMRRSEDMQRLMAEFTRGLAKSDGAIEICGWLPGFGLLLQGWAGRRLADRVEVLVETDGLHEGTACFASFSRPDVRVPACGMVGLVGGLERLDPSSLRRVYLPAPEGYRSLERLSAGTVLRPEDTASHLRHVMPSLQAEPAAAATLRRAVRPRYSGHETVSALQEPVRAAIDLAVRVPGGGFYLTGWLLDPLGVVRTMSLKGVRGQAERLDTCWTRIPRPDVTDGFRQDVRFAGLLGDSDHLHGFTVFLPGGDAGGDPRACHVELELSEDVCAFLPVAAIDGEHPATRRRLLTSFDIHKPSAVPIVERHLGPLFLSGGRRREKRVIACETVAGGASAGSARTAVLVPVLGGGSPPSVHLSQFAIRPLPPECDLTLVCSAAVDRGAVASLARYMDFYGVAGRILWAAEAIDQCDALEIGARESGGETIVFLSAGVFGAEAGWLEALLDGFGRLADAGAASPTILHEDFSVKSAGIERLDRNPEPPYITAASRYQGYPRPWVARKPVTEVLAAALECCVLRRRLVEDCGGFSDAYVLPMAKSLDFFLRLRAGGGLSYWVPGVEVYALDDGAAGGEPEYWQRTGALIDGWNFSRTWQDLLQADAPERMAV